MRPTLVPALVVLSLPVAAFGQSAADLADVSFGEDVAASLTVDDPVSSRGGYADRYTFTGAAGAGVVVSMSSIEVDCYLIIEGPDGSVVGQDDDGGEGTDSRLMVTLPADGRYTVVATSYSAGASGAYTLRVSEYQPRPLVADAIEYQVPVAGELDEDDAMIEGHGYVDAFDIELSVGDRVDVVVESYEFDTFLYLIGPTGERVGEDDDGAGSGTNSRISYTVGSSGVHRVLVTSYSGLATGAYTLTVGDGIVSSEPAEPIAPGELVEARLEAGDDPSDGGGVQDGYSVEIGTGRQLVVSMSSDDFDSYLTLMSPDGYSVAFDDDSGGNLNSQLSYVALDSGTYTIVASSYGGGFGAYTISATVDDPAPVTSTELVRGETVSGSLGAGDARPLGGGGHVDVFHFEGRAGDEIDVDLGQSYDVVAAIFAPTGEQFGHDSTSPFGAGFAGLGLPFTGRYTLTVTTYGAGPIDYALTLRDSGATAPVVAEPIAVGQTLGGVLEESDSTHARGGLQDVYELTVEEPGTVAISMDSGTVDGYLELFDADGDMIAWNDDSDGLNPAIRQYVGGGRYRIVATEFVQGGGPYTLTVAEQPTVPVTVESVEVGQHVVGMIAGTDAISVVQGQAADFYRVELAAGQQVTVTLESDAIDTYLVVVDPTGSVLVQDDDSGGDFNSRGTFTAAISGLYTVIATGYDAREGEYEMHIYEGAIPAVVGPEL